MLMEQAINVYMTVNATYTIYALYQTDRETCISYFIADFFSCK